MKAVTQTCKSCRHFSLGASDAAGAKMAREGFGRCANDGKSYQYRGISHTCSTYDATDRRKEWIAKNNHTTESTL